MTDPGPKDDRASKNAGDKATVQMRVNHQADHVNYQTVDGVITVQGWFLAAGDL
jgi:hypothetical protein